MGDAVTSVKPPTASGRAYRDVIYARYAEHTRVTGQTPEQYSYDRWAAATRWFLRDWLPHDRETPVLDLGCGAGYFLYLAQKLGYRHLTGVDLNADQIAFARQACADARIVHGDAMALLAETPGHYGLITGFDLIEHFAKGDLFDLLNAITAALAPGGTVVFQTPNAESPWGMKIRYGDFTHELAFSPQGLGSLLGLVGLDDYQARECGPYIHGVKSFVRFGLWRVLHDGLAFWNIVETGSPGSGIYTRVFVATARKRR